MRSESKTIVLDFAANSRYTINGSTNLPNDHTNISKANDTNVTRQNLKMINRSQSSHTLAYHDAIYEQQTERLNSQGVIDTRQPFPNPPTKQ